MSPRYVTPEVEALIGAETALEPAAGPVESSEVRRFFQALMDPDPLYWDPEAGAAGPYGGVVAPLGFPVHAHRRRPDEGDPLVEVALNDSDGFDRSFKGLPPLPVPLPRLLNGGYEYEFHRHARPGEVVCRRCRILDVAQKETRGGPMVVVRVEERYTVEDGAPLLTAINTLLLR